MADDSPTDFANAAAAAVLNLTYATQSPGPEGWRSPADASSVLRSLDQAISALPQAINQIWGLLGHFASDGLAQGEGSAYDLKLADARTALNEARSAAYILRTALARAHTATTSRS